MLSLVTGLLGVVGSGIKGFFGVKESQLQTINTAIEAVSQSNSSAAEKEAAIASVISAEVQSGYWLSAAWRPLVMCTFAGLVVAYFFGYSTPNLMQPIPEGAMISELFELVKIGLMGYMPLRTVEKIASQVNAGKIISDVLGKYRSK